MKSILSKSVLLSFLGHLTVFSFFTFSFGNKLPNFDNSAVVFRGEILSSADLARPLVGFGIKPWQSKAIHVEQTNSPSLDNSVQGKGILILGQLKPQVILPVAQEKAIFIEKLEKELGKKLTSRPVGRPKIYKK